MTLDQEACGQFGQVACGQTVHLWENHICNGGTCCKRKQWPTILFQFMHSCTQCHLDAVKHKQLVGPFVKGMPEARVGWHLLELHFVR